MPDIISLVFVVVSFTKLIRKVSGKVKGAKVAGGNPSGTVAEASSLNAREELLNLATNEKLKNCINEMYRPGATIGDGGLADAIRYEIYSGKLVGGKLHIQKGFERVKNLENIIAKQPLNHVDFEIATKLLNDLKRALGLGE